MFAKKAIVDFSKKATSLRGMTIRFNSNEGATGAVRPNGSSDNFRVSIITYRGSRITAQTPGSDP